MEPHQILLEDACKLGCHVLETLGPHPPQFLPQAKALLFYTSTRVGLGVGLEHGKGFIISRLPYSAALSCHSEWSPPWFISITGLEWGAVAGVERISTLVGVISERAFKELTSGTKIALGSDYSICMPSGTIKHPFKAQHHPEVMLDSDLCCVAVSQAGVMVDIGFFGTVFRKDKARNQRCYGSDVHNADVLGGKFPQFPEMKELLNAVEKASKAALVAAFEPSFGGESELDEEEE